MACTQVCKTPAHGAPAPAHLVALLDLEHEVAGRGQRSPRCALQAAHALRAGALKAPHLRVVQKNKTAWAPRKHVQLEHGRLCVC